jgi:mucin-19
MAPIVTSLASIVKQFGIGGLVAGPSFSATGGTVTYAAGKTIHTFTGSGDFTVTGAPPTFNVDYLVVAGGGGGANPSQGENRIAGSGAGGMLTGSAFPVSPGPYTITIGNGGVGNGPTPNNGGPSSFGPTITATGGGGGGRDDPAPTAGGTPGGSGGGAWYINSGGGGAGIPGQGYAGSPGFGTPEYGGGGGGAGGVGTRRFGGPGAPSSISGTSVTYAAGGESNNYPSTDRTANGTASTGNGGSGRGSGGSGIVIIAYPS